MQITLHLCLPLKNKISVCDAKLLQSMDNDGIHIVDLIPKKVHCRLRKTFGSAIPIPDDEPRSEPSPNSIPSRVLHTQTRKH
ncbi:hypothetical protein HAX54_020946 [Datura stramonium]|uniref:Uncharacterized protein n=1 Tax=Datura stramonium TaxID=4076 RepID=A0ABS8US06_DATST|nr:hypothetical protein [Datura stramonium]